VARIINNVLLKDPRNFQRLLQDMSDHIDSAEARISQLESTTKKVKKKRIKQ